jgi:hypothetical protein
MPRRLAGFIQDLWPIPVGADAGFFADLRENPRLPRS